MRLSDHQLVMSAFEGTLEESGFRDLQRRLAEEPELLALYRQHAMLHHSLCEEFEGRHMAGEAPPAPARAPRWVTGVVIATLVLAIAFAAWKWLSSPRPAQAMAGCDLSADAKVLVDGRAAVDGTGFSPGSRLTIERGWARINLPRKAVALVEAPASLVYEADKVLRLENGRVRFHLWDGTQDLTVKSPSLIATGHGPEFGILAKPGGSDEAHVFEGGLNVKAVTGQAAATLQTREAAAIDGEGTLQRMEAREPDFVSLTPEVWVMLEESFNSGTFETGRRPAVGASHWRLERGAPKIVGDHLEGTDFEAYFYLPTDALSAARPVLLVTVETVPAPGPPFHSPGWSGFSLYQEGYEVCFFGDSYGPEETWSLDVKRSLVPLMPQTLLKGPRTMTLRYDRRDGTIELHEGGSPGPDPEVRSKLLPGLNFDQIRIGASSGAAIGVKKVTVRALEEAPAR